MKFKCGLAFVSHLWLIDCPSIFYAWKFDYFFCFFLLYIIWWICFIPREYGIIIFFYYYESEYGIRFPKILENDFVVDLRWIVNGECCRLFWIVICKNERCEFNGVKPKFAMLWVVTCDLLCDFQLCEFIVGCEFVKNV